MRVRLACFAFFLAVPALADIFPFRCITNNSTGNCAIGEAQLQVDVTAAGTNQVLFTFRNVGSYASSIADVYFDDGTLLGIASVINSSGVNFSQGANPGNLPGANNISPPFETTAGFSADSDSPVQPNGVNPGEELGILFNLKGEQGYQNVLEALRMDPSLNGSLRIGIHVQGFASGGSESFVTPGPPSRVPEPSQYVVLGVGFAVSVWGARRRKRFGHPS